MSHFEFVRRKFSVIQSIQIYNCILLNIQVFEYGQNTVFLAIFFEGSSKRTPVSRSPTKMNFVPVWRKSWQSRVVTIPFHDNSTLHDSRSMEYNKLTINSNHPGDSHICSSSIQTITMTASPRILGCAINRYSVIRQTNTNKSSKTTKMTSVSALKIQSNRGSFSETYDGSEQHKKSLDKEHEIPSIFRARPVLEDDEDLDNNEFMILKRATPVFDTDEESPMKRLRRTSSFDDQDERDDANEGQIMASSILSWSDALLEGEDGFSFENIMLSR